MAYAAGVVVDATTDAVVIADAPAATTVALVLPPLPLHKQQYEVIA